MNWKIGKFNSVVVSDEKVKNTNFPVPPNSPESKDDEKDYYGGYLICESVGNKELSQLISAAPDLLEAIEYYFHVLKEVRGENWNENPKPVLAKMINAVNKAKKL